MAKRQYLDEVEFPFGDQTLKEITVVGRKPDWLKAKERDAEYQRQINIRNSNPFTRIPKEKGLEIVSPEFYILGGIRPGGNLFIPKVKPRLSLGKPRLPKINTSIAYRQPLEEGTNTTLQHLRTRLGDVEINNPNLYYRQGSGIVDDAINSGVIRTNNNVFPNAMFQKGNLHYGIPGVNTNKPDLITTSIDDMVTAGHHAEPIPMVKTYNGVTTVDTYGNSYIHRMGNIPRRHTIGYRWEDGYGYRKAYK